MLSEARPLQVVVISPDVSVLHETSWMLEAVGYVVQTTSELDRAALWRRYALADFVILDGRATRGGDPARGARFNSAVRYVEGADHASLAMVISEEGSVDVILRR